MISDYFDRILIINMPQALKRRAAMLFQMGRMNLKNINSSGRLTDDQSIWIK